MRSFRIICALLALAGNCSALTLELDYSQGGSYFLDPANSKAKETLEKAAQDVCNALDATLVAVPSDTFASTQGGVTISFNWDLAIKDPSDLSKSILLTSLALPADTVRLYVGATTAILGAEALGEGAPAGVEYSLDATGAATEALTIQALHNAEALSNLGLSRGTGPNIYQILDSTTVGATTVNFTLNVGALAGFLTFDKNAAWQFDYTQPVGANEFDFYTVMLHEILHALGFGSSQSWHAKVSGGTNWTGQNVINLLGSGVGLIHATYADNSVDGAHLADGLPQTPTVVGGTMQDAVMVSGLAKQTRRFLTQLDVAFLKDIGYVPAPAPTPTPTPTPTPAPTATPVPLPPEPPIVTGKSKQTTTLSKITVKGTLLAPKAIVRFKVGATGPLIKASGTSGWKFTVKLKKGVNTIYVESYDPSTGLSSTQKKLVITRR